VGKGAPRRRRRPNPCQLLHRAGIHAGCDLGRSLPDDERVPVLIPSAHVLIAPSFSKSSRPRPRTGAAGARGRYGRSRRARISACPADHLEPPRRSSWLCDWRIDWRASSARVPKSAVCSTFRRQTRSFLNRVRKFDSCRGHPAVCAWRATRFSSACVRKCPVQLGRWQPPEVSRGVARPRSAPPSCTASSAGQCAQSRRRATWCDLCRQR
jgi:hypothetical protein